MFLPPGVPWAVPLTLLFFLGLAVGGQLNRGIYRLAWFQRSIGPWSALHPDAHERHGYDRVPVLGWLALRRESVLHGSGFWVRPLLIELFCGLGFAGLYWWEVSGHLVPAVDRVTVARPGDLSAAVHAQVFSHLVLISLMVVATFIDIDEKTIPDAITVPGLLLGLVLAAVFPASHLPVISNGQVGNLSITTPHEWPSWLNGPTGMILGLLCFWGWIYGILPKTWWTRSGWRKAAQYLIASILRHPVTKNLLLLLVAGWAGIVLVWLWGANHWPALLSALVGSTFAGGLIWAVRLVASHALGREAMGFGDVTLMAMIGAYVGWQPSLFIFFLAPFAGLVIAVAQWILTRRKDIAYGPFLCLATLVLIVQWRPLWAGWGPAFATLGWIVPGLVVVCLVLMAVLLGGWNLICYLTMGSPTSAPDEDAS